MPIKRLAIMKLLQTLAVIPVEWLFVHTAESAEMTSATTLVMPVTRDIFAFTDRPNRQHSYMNSHDFVSLWDEADGDTFSADPPNAVLTWVDCDEVQEAEVVLKSATVKNYGRSIAYEVTVETGVLPLDELQEISLFVDPVIRKWKILGSDANDTQEIPTANANANADVPWTPFFNDTLKGPVSG